MVMHSSGTRMDSQRNILFGKLAILRSLLTRDQASTAFKLVSEARARGESSNLWDISVSRGFMSHQSAALVLRIIDEGQFVCRAGCKIIHPLNSFPPDRSFSCERCGGALNIVPKPGTAAALQVPTTRSPDSTYPGSGVRRPDSTHGASSPSTTHPGSSARRLTPQPRQTGRHDSQPSSSPPTPVPTAASSAPKLAARGGQSIAESAGLAAKPRLRKPAVEGELEHGERFAGYEIGRLLGRGGMGLVYKARRLRDDAVHALKVMLPNSLDNPDTIERFTREVKVSVRLRHPAIVAVYDAGYFEGRHWMAMEAVEGRDMITWRKEPGRSMGQGIRLMLGICEGMAYAHSKFIVHRDLKPGNVLVSREGDKPKICDFGLAKAVAERSSLTKTGDILGTPFYMSPEQARGDRLLIGPPTDVWALGVMLYEMATGKLPFTGRTTFGIINAIATEELKKPTSIGSRIPAEFEQIIVRSLEKEPKDRFRSAADLKKALDALF